MFLRDLSAALAVVAVASACGGAPPQSSENLAKLNARLADDTLMTAVPLDSCVRIHDLWKAQLRTALATVDEPNSRRNAAFLESIYRPHEAFWSGYVGDERAFARQVVRRWTQLETNPRAAIPLDNDVGAFIRETSERAAAMVDRPVPCADWHLLYGPGWTNMGGLAGGLGMLVDFFGFPQAGGAEALRIYTPHEIAHLMFDTGPDDPAAGTLLQIIVDEGFATYFSVIYGAGEITPARALSYSPAEWQWAVEHEHTLWRLAEPHLASRESDVINRFRAVRERVLPEAPGKIGYFLGYRIIEAYVRRHGDESWRELFDIPVYAMLDESGYPGTAPR